MVGADFLGIVIESFGFNIFKKVNGAEACMDADDSASRQLGNGFKRSLERGRRFKEPEVEVGGIHCFHVPRIAATMARFLDFGQGEASLAEE